MGVPITFIDKYSPEQFEIIGFAGGWNGNSPLVTKKYPKQQRQYNRDGSVSAVGKLNDGTPIIALNDKPQNMTYYRIDDEFYYIRTYGRILIRRKQVQRDEN